MKVLRTNSSVLEIAYEASGPAGGQPVALMYGFAYSVRAYNKAVEVLVVADAHVILPHLSSFGA